MSKKFEILPKGFLVTCVGFLASSLGVFVSILSVIVSPLFSLFSTPKPIFIGEGKTGSTPRLQNPSQKIRPRHTRQPSSDKTSSHSSNTLSSNDTVHSTYSNRRRTPSPNGTRSHNNTHNTSESLVQSRPSTPQIMSIPPSPSQARSPRNDLRTYLGIRKRSTLLAEPTPEEPSPTAGEDKLDLDEGSHEQQLDRAEIIVSPPTPSSSIFLHSTPGPSEAQFAPGKPAARFVKSHSKRHSLTAVCPRKRRSAKRSSNSPTPKSSSPATTPVAESSWHIAIHPPQRKKRKSLRIEPPRRSATSAVFIENGDDVGSGTIHEEPTSITRPPTSRLPLTSARQGPSRTRPYEAPYFFPTPGSPEAIGYTERVLEERRSFIHPDPTSVRNKKDSKRSATITISEKDGAVGNPKLGGEGNQNQSTEDGGTRKRPKNSEKASGDKNVNPVPVDEFGIQVGTPTSPRPQAQRQGSRGILRILGKH